MEILRSGIPRSYLNSTDATLSGGAVKVPTDAMVLSRIGGAGAPDATELSYVNGVTSAIQTQLDAKIGGALPTPSDDSYVGITDTGTAGENLSRNELVYLKASDHKLWKAKGDSATTMNAVGIVVADALADATVTYLVLGKIRDDSAWAALNDGAPFYVSSATAGLLTQTAPSTVGHIVQLCGRSKFAGAAGASKVLFVNFNDLQITVAASTALDPTLADHAYNGAFFTATAGENLVLGDVCYLKAADSKMWKADASATATMPGVVMATASISADASGVFLQRGFIRNDDGWGGALTVAGLLYTSGTAGPPTQTAPAVSGDQVQVVGYAYAARVVFFDPNLMLVEVP